MIILGLTGSIGMGKSFAAKSLRRLGVPVHDADAAVHALLASGGAAVTAVEAAFPGVTSKGAVDRQKLAKQVFDDPAALARLEALLHPRVRAEARRFLSLHARRRSPVVVLDIPLLFETGGERLCDAVIVVTAPRSIQAARVLSRPGMTEERFEAILAKQMSDRDKRRRADFVVPTGRSKGETLRNMRAIVRLMGRRKARHWPPSAYRPRRRKSHRVHNA